MSKPKDGIEHPHVGGRAKEQLDQIDAQRVHPELHQDTEAEMDPRHVAPDVKPGVGNDHAVQPPTGEPKRHPDTQNPPPAPMRHPEPAGASWGGDLETAFELEQAFASLEQTVKDGKVGDAFTSPEVKGLKLWHHKVSAIVTVTVQD